MTTKVLQVFAELTVGFKKGTPTQKDNYELLVVNYKGSGFDLFIGWNNDEPKNEGTLFTGNQ